MVPKLPLNPIRFETSVSSCLYVLKTEEKQKTQAFNFAVTQFIINGFCFFGVVTMVAAERFLPVN